MTKRKIERVIDADIAHSAGETTHPISKNCRLFLEAVMENKHTIVMTKDIMAEWRRHQSKYSSVWLRKMISKKRLKPLRIKDNEKLEPKLSELGLSGKQEKIALKDCHLIDAALKSRRTIASGDDEARDVFSIASEKNATLRKLIWINPKTMGDRLRKWLENKMSPEKTWFLSQMRKKW